MFISTRKRNWPKINKERIQNKTKQKKPQYIFDFSVVLPLNTDQNMDKFKILFPLFPLAKMISSVIFKRGFTSKHRKYQKQEKKKAKVKK